MSGFMCLVFAVVATITLMTNAMPGFGTWPDTCLSGLEKDSPSTETEEFPMCKPWQDFSCCTWNQTRTIDEDHSRVINFLTDACGPLSKECKQYLLTEECFYFCEPMLQHWGIENRTGMFNAAPICGSYCDEWFDACKDDMTCAGNWLEGLYLDPESRDCPANGSTCVTFREMYGDGKGMCNALYSFEYAYEESDKNCMVMNFDGENPNLHGNPYDSGNNVAYSLVTHVFGVLIYYFHM